jgi:hypothetical protein
MQIPEENNYAFIDGANLHKGIEKLGWHLDYARFRIWLKEKYHVAAAYLFIGFVPNNEKLYLYLENAGYILIYKEITYGNGGKVKGNCDADLVLYSIIFYFEQKFSKAVIVSSDGDYAGLINFLNKKGAFEILLSPSDKCSYLLWKSGVKITHLNNKRSQIEKAPDKDETL